MRAYNTITFCKTIFSVFFFNRVRKKKKLFTGFGSVRIVKNCDLGLEKPRSQFFTIRTSQPVNNIYIYIYCAFFCPNMVKWRNSGIIINVISSLSCKMLNFGIISNTATSTSRKEWRFPLRLNKMGAALAVLDINVL